jgi:hypothetical protein
VARYLVEAYMPRSRARDARAAGRDACVAAEPLLREGTPVRHLRTTAPRAVSSGKRKAWVEALALACVECDRRAGKLERGWEGHRVDLDDDGEDEDEVVLFCPACAIREFGPRNTQRAVE